MLRYLHIPKTAGTSFGDCLERIYPGTSFFFSGNLSKDLERYRKIPPRERRRITLFAGHSPRITGIPEIDALPTITLLREPIARVKSFCQHVSEGKSPYLLERFPPARFHLDDFLESGIEELANFQTRMFLGDANYALPMLEQASLVKQTMEILEHKITAFGIFEKLDTSLLMFRQTLGWREYPVCDRLNVRNASRLVTFNSAHIAKIRELNAIDMEVYQKACESFDTRIAQIFGSLERERSLFEHDERRSSLFWGIQNIRRHTRRRYVDKDIDHSF